MNAGYFQKTEEQPDIRPAEKPKRIKRTWYVSEETDRMLKRIQLSRYEETGTEPELSDLVEEAIKKLAS
jgi:hypothetical protein